MAHDKMRILVLGGAQEGDQLAGLLRDRHRIDTVLVRPPNLEGPGLTQPALHLLLEKRADLEDLMQGVAAVVIAAHPFSGRFAEAVAEIARARDLPCLRLMRDPWRPGPNDIWHSVESPREAAAEIVRQQYERPFIAVGRDQLGPFLALAGRDLFLRLPGSGPLPEMRRGKVLADPGPFSVAGEIALFQRNRISCIVARNIGGRGGWPKLQAARTLRLPVILLRRPHAPGCALRSTAEDALAWLDERLGLDLGVAVT